MIRNKIYRCLKQNGNWISILFLVGLFTMLFSQVAFAGNPGEFAVIHEDPAVKNIFKLKQLPSEYNYYYTIIIFGTNNRLTVFSPYQPDDRI